MEKEVESPVQHHEEAEPGLLRPRWHEGDAWEVNYRVRTLNPEKLADPPPRYLELRWRYEVTSVADDRVMIIGRVDHEFYTFRVQMELSSASSSLVSIVPGYDVADSERPYLPLRHDLGGERIDAWPLFPLQLGAKDFGEGTLIQEVEVLPEHIVVEISRRGRDMGDMRERTVTQRWEHGKPWWTESKTIGRTSTQSGVYEEVEVEGVVTAW